VSFSFARIRVDSLTTSETPFDFPTRAARALEMPKGGESMSTDLIHYLRARFGVEEGQTMAEYGVVLAVITVAVIVALGLLSGAIGAALDEVRSHL
jgi:Flp pilus assembly pilin Flp